MHMSLDVCVCVLCIFDGNAYSLCIEDTITMHVYLISLSHTELATYMANHSRLFELVVAGLHVCVRICFCVYMIELNAGW